MLDKDLNSESQALVPGFSNRMFHSAYLSLEQWEIHLVLGKEFHKSDVPTCLGLANTVGRPGVSFYLTSGQKGLVF